MKIEMTMDDLDNIKFDAHGLIPAIVQDYEHHNVLMLAYMNSEALKLTLKGPDVWFYSRSRKRLWHKGETSGNVIKVRSVRSDCDGDALLVLGNPTGPVCHKGTETCFYQLSVQNNGDRKKSNSSIEILNLLACLISSRRKNLPKDSYTSSLFKQGRDRIAQKVVEEAGEVAIAAVSKNGGNVVGEVADMIFHTMVLLEDLEINISEVWTELANRQKNNNG